LVVPRGYTDDRTNERLQLASGRSSGFRHFLDDVNNQLGIKLSDYGWLSKQRRPGDGYAKGRTTLALDDGGRPGESYHQYGMATTLRSCCRTAVNYKSSVAADRRIAAAHGIDWGGWFNKPDRDHFERAWAIDAGIAHFSFDGEPA